MRRSKEEREEKKLFRTELVEGLVDLDPIERSRMIEQLAQQTHRIPYSQKTTLSRSTFYQWLKQYRESRKEETMLMDKVRKDRDQIRAITEQQQEALIRWRGENPYRTAEQLREELLFHPSTNHSTIPSVSTITRFLRKKHYDRRTLLALSEQDSSKKPSTKIRLSFESDYPQQIWQIDTKGPNIEVLDPDNPEKTVVVRPIVILDDYSRYLIAVCHVIAETEAAVMNVVRSAIAAFGVPHVLYTDRGGPYVGASLRRALRLLGCRTKQTPPNDAQAKGKVEKVMQFITHHIESEIQASGCCCTLEQLHELTAAVVDQEYHRRVHSETNQTPEDRYAQFPVKYRCFVTDKTLASAFLRSTKAKVSKVGVIRCHKQQYLVPNVVLYGKKVIIRYDPRDLSKIHVWYDDQYYGEAVHFVRDNDYQKRLELQEQLASKAAEVERSQSIPVPRYSRLERLLAAQRREFCHNDLDLNDELEQVRKSVETAKATLRGTKTESTTSTVDAQPWDVGAFTHLLSVLLRQKFSASHRLAIAAVWSACGPLSETLVRKTVGEMLGNSHPTSDLHGYLEALRIAALTSERGGEA